MFRHRHRTLSTHRKVYRLERTPRTYTKHAKINMQFTTFLSLLMATLAIAAPVAKEEDTAVVDMVEIANNDNTAQRRSTEDTAVVDMVEIANNDNTAPQRRSTEDYAVIDMVEIANNDNTEPRS
ncbi:hypothetical protein HII31_10503 [Pseudocercospora fuligena]|uniref:Uncharacterized protein n=1 Tax=Pseudocercospora fuligena TaxID=685502 RepID=A0A8H6VDE7_9PEZI|nr:hypothetical protein HII31_10503 [Pseudocercospora fuligena]